MYFFFFFNDTATTEIYTYCHTLSLHDALPIYEAGQAAHVRGFQRRSDGRPTGESRIRPGLRHPLSASRPRSEEHTSELQSLMRISYAVFCLKKKKKNTTFQATENIITKTKTRHTATAYSTTNKSDRIKV